MQRMAICDPRTGGALKGKEQEDMRLGNYMFAVRNNMDEDEKNEHDESNMIRMVCEGLEEDAIDDLFAGD